MQSEERAVWREGWRAKRGLCGRRGGERAVCREGCRVKRGLLKTEQLCGGGGEAQGQGLLTWCQADCRDPVFTHLLTTTCNKEPP